MKKEELCKLFGIYTQTLENCLATIFSFKALRIEDVCHYHQYVKGDKVCYDITEVNLELIVTLSFQINSPQAILVRNWFVEQCLKLKRLDLPFVAEEQNYSWN